MGKELSAPGEPWPVVTLVTEGGWTSDWWDLVGFVRRRWTERSVSKRTVRPKRADLWIDCARFVFPPVGTVFQLVSQWGTRFKGLESGLEGIDRL